MFYTINMLNIFGMSYKELYIYTHINMNIMRKISDAEIVTCKVVSYNISNVKNAWAQIFINDNDEFAIIINHTLYGLYLDCNNNKTHFQILLSILIRKFYEIYYIPNFIPNLIKYIQNESLLNETINIPSILKDCNTFLWAKTLTDTKIIYQYIYNEIILKLQAKRDINQALQISIDMIDDIKQTISLKIIINTYMYVIKESNILYKLYVLCKHRKAQCHSKHFTILIFILIYHYEEIYNHEDFILNYTHYVRENDIYNDKQIITLDIINSLLDVIKLSKVIEHNNIKIRDISLNIMHNLFNKSLVLKQEETFN